MSAPAELVGYLSYLAKNYLIQTWLFVPADRGFWLKAACQTTRHRAQLGPAQGRIETVAVDAFHVQKLQPQI
jgi:hypothetical protein